MSELYAQRAGTYPELMRRVSLERIRQLRLRGRPTHPYSWGCVCRNWGLENDKMKNGPFWLLLLAGTDAQTQSWRELLDRANSLASADSLGAALGVGAEALEAAMTAGADSAEALILARLGRFHDRAGNSDSAVLLLSRSLALQERETDSGSVMMAGTLEHLGLACKHH